MPSRTVSEARHQLAELLNIVAYRGERVSIERRGLPVAVLISVEDAQLLESLEDRMDLEMARKALAGAKSKGEKPIPWSKVKKQLGL